MDHTKIRGQRNQMNGGITMKKMLSILTGLSMLLGTAALPVCAEEPVRDWDYYWNLDDYSVYKEFVETHGKPWESDASQYVPEETLPQETDLPWYEDMHYYVTNDACFYGLTYWVEDGYPLTDQEVFEMAETPSYFGFPDAWHLDKYEMIYENEDGGAYLDVGCHVVQPSGASCCGRIDLRFDQLKNIGAEEIPVIRSVVDLYRIQLTLEHSKFAAEHVQKTKEGYDFRFEPPSIAPSGATDVYCIPGDPNNDGIANASDAAAILIEAAALGAGNTCTFSENQTLAADVNKDQVVNSSDAAVILMYSAAVGSGTGMRS